MIQQLLKDSTIYGLAGVASRFVSILLIPLYTRLFSPEDYGVLDLLITTSWILVLLSGMQVDSGVARSYYEAINNERSHTLIGTGLSLYVVSTLIWLPIFIVIYGIWFQGYIGITWVHVIPLLLAVLPNQFHGYWLLLLRLEKRPYLFACLSIGDIVTNVLLVLVLVIWLQAGIAGVMWALFISKFVWALIGYTIWRNQLTWVWHSVDVKGILAYGLPLVPAVLSKWAQNHANRFILVATVSLVDVGIFSLAVKIASIVALIDSAFRMAWTPYFFELMDQPDSDKIYARTLDYYFVSMFGICIFVSAVAWPIIRILSTEAYLTASGLVSFITMGLLWTGTLNVINAGVAIVRKTYWMPIGFAVGGIANLVALWWTIETWGIVAAGITYLLGTLLTVVIILFAAQYSRPIPYRYSTISLVAISSIIVPVFFYYFDIDSTTSSNGIILNVSIKFIIAMALWIGICYVAIQRSDRLKLLQMVRNYV